jgi:hypothetical protein
VARRALVDRGCQVAPRLGVGPVDIDTPGEFQIQPGRDRHLVAQRAGPALIIVGAQGRLRFRELGIQENERFDSKPDQIIDTKRADDRRHVVDRIGNAVRGRAADAIGLPPDAQDAHAAAAQDGIFLGGLILDRHGIVRRLEIATEEAGVAPRSWVDKLMRSSVAGCVASSPTGIFVSCLAPCRAGD